MENMTAKKAQPHKRILLVDDHPMTREWHAAEWIGSEPDLVRLRQAENAEQALDAVSKSKAGPRRD